MLISVYFWTTSGNAKYSGPDVRQQTVCQRALCQQSLSVSGHFLSQRALPRSAGTASVSRHSLIQRALSRSAGTVSVSGHCPGQRALSQPAGTVPVSSHCPSQRSLSQSNPVSIPTWCLHPQSLNSATFPNAYCPSCPAFSLHPTHQHYPNISLSADVTVMCTKRTRNCALHCADGF